MLTIVIIRWLRLMDNCSSSQPGLQKKTPFGKKIVIKGRRREGRRWSRGRGEEEEDEEENKKDRKKRKSTPNRINKRPMYQRLLSRALGARSPGSKTFTLG